MDMEAIVEYSYVAQEPDELTIRKGDLIKDIRVMPGGWWEGTLRDKRGMFPDNFVKVREPSSSVGGGEAVTVKNEEVTLRNGGTGTTGSGRRWCKVLFSYEPCNEDELALALQDSVEFLGEVEEGWWRGRLRGRVGVFPSNFVSAPIQEEQERTKERDKDKREKCRVLFPYEAANEDELTLVEGEVLTVLSKDAPDKGWWKGELRGQVGLFPDNFVELLGPKSKQDQEQHQEPGQGGAKTGTKYASTGRRTEKAHARRSLDPRNVPTEGGRKSLSSSSSASSSIVGVSGGAGDKKPANNQSILMSNIKQFAGDGNNNDSNDGGVAGSGLGEELDGVGRGEGVPLSHPTASRAKAPRRRLPSAQHLRHHTGTTSPTVTSSNISLIIESGLANGSSTTSSEPSRDEETDGAPAKGRRKAPWVEELKLNQLERRKVSPTERVDKMDSKKARNETSRVSAVAELSLKLEKDAEMGRPKLKEERGGDHNTEGGEQSPLTTPAYVPYPLYSQLLERVVQLEEKQVVLQRTITRLTDQLVPLLTNASTNNKL